MSQDQSLQAYPAEGQLLSADDNPDRKNYQLRIRGFQVLAQTPHDLC